MVELNVASRAFEEAWKPLRYHAEQARLFGSEKRFTVAYCGRRSGKSHIERRKAVLKGLMLTRANGLVVCAGPTRPHAKFLHWDQIKALVPRAWMACPPRESDLTIRLKSGTEIVVAGVEEPERLEGRPIDHLLGDEFADWKPRVWTESIRPALETDGRPGSASIIGVPKGRNHFWELVQKALESIAKLGDASEWGVYHWKSAEILSAAAIASARADMDELTFQQEMEASFVTFEGRAYYAFDRDIHARESLERFYNPRAPLFIALDFNVTPGVAAIGQIIDFHGKEPSYRPQISRAPLAWLGEVWIPRNSNTPAVCRKIVADWAPRHEGPVMMFGDATGGQRRTSGERGSDWDIVRQEMQGKWRGGISFDGVPRTNPAERTRVNSFNSLLLSTDGQVRMLFDPTRCPRSVVDCEGVVLLKGGSGELEKITGGPLTHISDAQGYCVAKEFPIHDHGVEFHQVA